MIDILDQTKPLGTITLNILASIGTISIVALIGWIIGPFKWWSAGNNLRKILLSGRNFIFVYNPTNNQAKELTFLKNGEIGEGRNTNEYLWRIHHGKLDILGFDGKIYSRFVHDKNTGLITHTNDADTRSIHGQFMIPHFTPWQSISENQGSNPAE